MFYWAAKGIVRAVLALLFRVRVEGLENFPRQGAALIVANHLSLWDPPLIGAFLPRRLYYLGKQELFRIPILGPVLRHLGVHPVQRGTADRRSIRWALERLAEEQAVLIFPEGTRSRTGTLQAGQPGVALIAARAGTQVVPIGIVGRYRCWRPLRLIIGKPLDFSGYREHRLTRELLQDLTDRMVMPAIAQLLPKEVRAEAPARHD